jgi:hypothetical protein
MRMSGGEVLKRMSGGEVLKRQDPMRAVGPVKTIHIAYQAYFVEI